jgi:perosamine synthetase
MIAAAHPTLRFADVLRKPSAAGRAVLETPGLHLTYNGRAALYQLFRALREMRDGVVLVPAFHCPTVVDPALRAGFDVAFYRIREDLTVDVDDLAARATGRVAAVVAIHYVGFAADLVPLLALGRQRGFLLIEDWAHSFLRAAPAGPAGDSGDAIVYSFYKLVPTYAGGAFWIRSAAIPWRGSPRPLPPGRSIVIAKRLAEQAVGNSGSATLRGLFARLESARVALRRRQTARAVAGDPPAEHDPYEFDSDLAGSEMPWLSRVILRACDPEAIVAARRRNYTAWNEGLVETPRIRKLRTVLPPDVCPWAYPVLLEDRSAHDHILRAQGVPLFTFGERLHPLFHERTAGAFPEAETLSRNLLLLGVHQNLKSDAIRQACETVNTHFRDTE